MAKDATGYNLNLEIKMKSKLLTQFYYHIRDGARTVNSRQAKLRIGTTPAFLICDDLSNGRMAFVVDGALDPKTLARALDGKDSTLTSATVRPYARLKSAVTFETSAAEKLGQLIAVGRLGDACMADIKTRGRTGQTHDFYLMGSIDQQPTPTVRPQYRKVGISFPAKDWQEPEVRATVLGLAAAVVNPGTRTDTKGLEGIITRFVNSTRGSARLRRHPG